MFLIRYCLAETIRSLYLRDIGMFAAMRYQHADACHAFQSFLELRRKKRRVTSLIRFHGRISKKPLPVFQRRRARYCTIVGSSPTWPTKRKRAASTWKPPNIISIAQIAPQCLFSFYQKSIVFSYGTSHLEKLGNLR